MLQPQSERIEHRDGGETDGQFVERAALAMRSALQAHLRQPVPDDRLRRALRALARDARTSNLRPEQLIVVLKQAWGSLPEIEQRTANRRQDVLDRVVTICIEEYYATRAD